MPMQSAQPPCGSRSMSSTRLPSLGAEQCGEIDGRGRLGDAALLVGDDEDAGVPSSLCSPMNCARSLSRTR